MIGKIFKIIGNLVFIELSINIEQQVNLINLHVVFFDDKNKIIGEITAIDKNVATISIKGYLENNNFYQNIVKKPSFKSNVRLIETDELSLILGDKKITSNNQIYFGRSTIYPGYKINLDINQFFSNHFIVSGTTGSGKSCGVARILQNLFINNNYFPKNSNIFMFDAYGEYNNIFPENNNLKHKIYTTDTTYPKEELLNIPLWLLDSDDIGQLLGVENKKQLVIIDKSLKYARLLVANDDQALTYKNDIIARSIKDILLSGKKATIIRDQIIAVLSNFNTNELNINTQIIVPGYSRNIKQCLIIDNNGKIQDIDLIVEFISNFIEEKLELYDFDQTVTYTLEDLRKAMDFALLSEGVLNNEKVYEELNVLSVRLQHLITSPISLYFSRKDFINRKNFIHELIHTKSGEKAQIINFNVSFLDDRTAKAITKIISRILFNYATDQDELTKYPFHIIMEEAHRYVQNDHDEDILGYNIFNRIIKEGRKYGVLVGLITQRIGELSEIAISQSSNFLVFKTFYSKDIECIKTILSNVTPEIIEQVKTFTPGNALVFGTAFKLPVLINLDKPNPEPISKSIEISDLWFKEEELLKPKTENNKLQQNDFIN